jgi:hypothetical protein
MTWASLFCQNNGCTSEPQRQFSSRSGLGWN